MRCTLRLIAVYLGTSVVTILLGVCFVYGFVIGTSMICLGTRELQYFKDQILLNIEVINGAFLLMGAGNILILLTMLFACFVTPKLEGWFKRNRG